jgi:hypothetical protein
MRRKTIVSLLVLSMLVIMAFAMTGCAEQVPKEPTTYEKNAVANEQAVENLIKNDKLPQITKSLERENIKRRIEFINQPDRIGYLYLLSENGQLIKEVQVLGKVSSLNSYLTPMEDIQIIKHDGGEYTAETPVVTQAADLDGTYGENAQGIFWFTPDGVYQEWSGLYFYSSERMSFTTKPLLIETTNGK